MRQYRREINSILGADTIEVCSVLGWIVVTRKEEFKPNDKCVYVEIASLLSVKPEFEFLRKNCYKKNDNGERFRIKTLRLRGQISQGICFPLSILPKGIEFGVLEGEGKDVTELLGIEKHIPAIHRIKRIGNTGASRCSNSA